MVLMIRLRKSDLSQKNISFLWPSTWNKSSDNLKFLNTATSFSHNYKKLVIIKKPDCIKHALN